MWSRLGGLTDAVKDGLSEFRESALKEIGGVSPVTGAVAGAVKSGAEVARSLTGKARRRESRGESPPPAASASVAGGGLARWMVDAGSSSSKGDRSSRGEAETRTEEEDGEEGEGEKREDDGEEDEEEREEAREGLRDKIGLLFNFGLGGGNGSDEEEEVAAASKDEWKIRKPDEKLGGWEGGWQEEELDETFGDNEQTTSSSQLEGGEAGMFGRRQSAQEGEAGGQVRIWQRMSTAEGGRVGEGEGEKEEMAVVKDLEEDAVLLPVAQENAEVDELPSRYAKLDATARPKMDMADLTSVLTSPETGASSVSVSESSEHPLPEERTPEKGGQGGIVISSPQTEGQRDRGLSILSPQTIGQRNRADESESAPIGEVVDPDEDGSATLSSWGEAVTVSTKLVDGAGYSMEVSATPQKESRERGSAVEKKQGAAEWESSPDRALTNAAATKEGKGKEQGGGAMQSQSELESAGKQQGSVSGGSDSREVRSVGKLAAGEMEAQEARSAAALLAAEGEVEKWLRECEMLRKLLVKAAEDRGQLAVQLGSMEDKLEERNALVTRLELELQVASSTALKQREVLEQKVKVMASTLEKRMEALTGEISNRDGEIAELRQENEEMGNAFKSLRNMLEESVSEREKLAEELNEQQRLFQDAKDIQARLEVEVESARREAADSGVELADLNAELWAVREAAKGRALGEDERQSLEQALRAVSASAATAAAEASSWQSKAQALEKELQAQAKALAGTEAELALARQQVLDAEAEKEKAHRLKDAAEGLKERLQEESEIRTKRFNAAVRTAVGKIQAKLETERDAGLERIVVLEAEVASQAKSLEDAMKRIEEQAAQLVTMNEEAALISTEKEKMAEEVKNLHIHIQEAERREREASEQAAGAQEAAHAFSLKMAELEAKCFEAQAALESSVKEGLEKESAVREELEEVKASLASAERDKKALKNAAVEGSYRTAEELGTLRAKVAELEGKLGVSDLRLARMAGENPSARGGDAGNRTRGYSSSGRSQTASTLENLGLDALREERLMWKSKGLAGDMEAGSEPLHDYRMRRLTKRVGSASSDGEWKESSVMDWIMRGRSKELFGFDEMRGTVSRRSAILIIYIMVLHIMVMVSFTHKSPECGDGVTNLEAKLPGF